VKETREKTPPRKDGCIMHLSYKTYRRIWFLDKAKDRKGKKI
jgi:hypothetical protein